MGRFICDFDVQFASSPPSHDDSFFLIRYPGSTSLLSSGKTTTSSSSTENPETQSASSTQDWSRHTQPCQQFISGVPYGKLNKCPPTIKPKPAGTDDGFKGEAAACGSSIVRVAHQMISGRSLRGMSVEPISEEGTLQMTKGHETPIRKDSLAPGPGYNLNARRGSKSLPASPLSSPPGSPGSKRKNKNVVNRFFTGPFELPPDISGSRSWILAGLLGQQREAYPSNTKIEEAHDEGSLAASIENLDPAPAIAVAAEAAAKLSQQFQPSNSETTPKSQVYRPKPSELREMNFWSPTSM